MKRSITTQRTLLTEDWTSDVEILEAAIDRMAAERVGGAECRVVLFEVVRDSHLHVNVTHAHATKGTQGWAGPAHTPDGFVSNRTFSTMRPDRIAHHIRAAVFAERV